MSSQATSQVESSGGEHFKCEISRLGCEDRNQHLDRCPAQFAWIALVKRRFYDSLCAILGRRNELGDFGFLWNCLLVAKIFVNIGNTDSRTYALNSDMIESLQEIFEQANLPLIRRREIGMTALRTVGKILRTIPGEKRFA